MPNSNPQTDIAPREKPLYSAPRLARVQIEIARNKTGETDANNNCTIHMHDDASAGQPCEFP